MDALPSTNVADFLRDVYFPLRMLGKKPGSHKLYRYQVAAFSRLLGRAATLADLSDTQIGRALSLRIQEGAAPATINKLRSVLMAVANFAWRRRMIDMPPQVSPLPMDDPETTVYSAQDVGRILAICADRTDWLGWYCLVLLLWYTGTRIAAMLSLRCDDCQLPKIVIRGRAQKQRRTQAFIVPDDACQAVASILPPPRAPRLSHSPGRLSRSGIPAGLSEPAGTFLVGRSRARRAGSGRRAGGMTPKARHGLPLTEDRQMLVLQRRENERIVLHARGRTLAVVTLVEIRGDKARIGIQALAEIAVDREEVFRSKMEDRRHV